MSLSFASVASVLMLENDFRHMKIAFGCWVNLCSHGLLSMPENDFRNIKMQFSTHTQTHTHNTHTPHTHTHRSHHRTEEICLLNLIFTARKSFSELPGTLQINSENVELVRFHSVCITITMEPVRFHSVRTTMTMEPVRFHSVRIAITGGSVPSGSCPAGSWTVRFPVHGSVPMPYCQHDVVKQAQDTWHFADDIATARVSENKFVERTCFGEQDHVQEEAAALWVTEELQDDYLLEQATSSVSASKLLGLVWSWCDLPKTTWWNCWTHSQWWTYYQFRQMGLSSHKTKGGS